MKEGNFLKIDFTGTLKATGELFETTVEEEAKKAHVKEREGKYGPALVIIGGKMAVPGVEAKLKEMKIGDEQEFDVPFMEAYGKRDVKLIQIINVNKFYNNDPPMNPIPGAFLEIDGKNCKIQSVSGGRVRVDFNNPLSGRDLHYKVKIVSEVTDPKHKIHELLEHYGMPFRAEVTGEKAVIHADRPVNQLVKTIILGSIKKWVKEVKDVEVKEPGQKDAEKPAEHSHEHDHEGHVHEHTHEHDHEHAHEHKA